MTPRIAGLTGLDARAFDGAILAGLHDAAQPTVYRREECATFFRTSERWGGLSNMAGGFPILVNGVAILTSEAIYQACRFPHLPEVQREIIAQASPIAAKMKSRAHQKDSRTDFHELRIPIMWWSLRAKLACNSAAFGALLLETEGRTIVENSSRDAYWGALSDKTDPDILVGRNVLGRMLVLLRQLVEERGAQALQAVPPLLIPNFLLYGEQIRPLFCTTVKGVGCESSSS